MESVITLKNMSKVAPDENGNFDFGLGLDHLKLDKRILINQKWLNTELGDEFEKRNFGLFAPDLGVVDFVIEWDQTCVAYITQADLVDCVGYHEKLWGMARTFSAEKVKIFVDMSARTSYYNAFEEFVKRDLRHFYTPIVRVGELPKLLKEMADEEGKPFDPYVMKAYPVRTDRERPSPRKYRNVKREYNGPPKKCIIAIGNPSTASDDVSSDNSA